MNIIQLLFTEIEKKGVTLTVLSKKTGISKQNLNRIHQSSDIKFSHFLAICKAIDIEPEELIANFGDHKQIIEEKNRVIDQLHEKVRENEIEINALNAEIRKLRNFKDFYSDFIRLFLKGFIEYPKSVPIFAPLMKVFDANPEIRDTVEKDPKIEKEFMRFFSNIVSSFSSEQIEELEKSFKTSGETG